MILVQGIEMLLLINVSLFNSWCFCFMAILKKKKIINMPDAESQSYFLSNSNLF